MKLQHIDLFSGIGGFSLALDTIFYDHTIEHTFCDNNPFAQAVLKKHWPESKIYGDIRTVTNTRSTKQWGISSNEREKVSEIRSSDQFTSHAKSSNDYGNTGKIQSEDEWQTKERPQKWLPKSSGTDCFLVTGGFPCQPFSAAGRRKGTADDRYLWPEMYRVIKEFQPEWVVAENVRGLVTWNDGMVLEQVCSDLEVEGYEVQPLIIPAVAVNAPHRRDRIWFIGHNATGKRYGKKNKIQTGRDSIVSTSSNASDTRCERWQPGGNENIQSPCQKPERTNSGQRDWQRDWPQVAAELCSVDDGLPGRMGDVTISRAKHRNEQLKAYGNAIVPQVAMEIFQAIKNTLTH